MRRRRRTALYMPPGKPGPGKVIRPQVRFGSSLTQVASVPGLYDLELHTSLHWLNRLTRTLVMQMHDIVSEVFEHLAPGLSDRYSGPWEVSDRKRTQQTLASAARVCRLWSEPALDVLWRVTDSFLYLFNLLPSLEKTRISGNRESYVSSSTPVVNVCSQP